MNVLIVAGLGAGNNPRSMATPSSRFPHSEGPPALPDTQQLDGPALRRIVLDAQTLLEHNVEALNGINVFPVPDGDTGTNMFLTLKSATDEPATGSRAADVADGMARGALLGARGNSGVILSQLFRGLSAALAGSDAAAGVDVVRTFEIAAGAAREAISEPREGTLLTVLEDVARELSEARPDSFSAAIAAAVASAQRSVARTPELLPVLKEAGVVDAGGAGLAIILEGFARSLTGESLEVDMRPAGAVSPEWRDALHEAGHGAEGYCTEFIIDGVTSETAVSLRDRFSELGTSVVVVRSDPAVRVHLHTSDPDGALAYGRTLGALSHVKVDNLQRQIASFAEEAIAAPVTASISVVAVASGAGLEATFRSLGVTGIVRGGQTMNPSAGELRAAIDASSTDDVIVLPNNGNIVPAAQQAAAGTGKRVQVLPATTIPQGIAAVLALNHDLSFEENVAAISRAIKSVRSAEITRAVRPVSIGDTTVATGQIVGIVDGELVVVEDDVQSAVRSSIERMLSPEATLLTMYCGEEINAADAEALLADTQARFGSLEIELVWGGQPNYPYILSLE